MTCVSRKRVSSLTRRATRVAQLDAARDGRTPSPGELFDCMDAIASGFERWVHLSTAVVQGRGETSEQNGSELTSASS